jgi:hypothetical protein
VPEGECVESTIVEQPVSSRYHYFAIGDIVPPSAMTAALPATDP